jgi:flagellar biosynthesis protein FliP
VRACPAVLIPLALLLLLTVGCVPAAEVTGSSAVAAPQISIGVQGSNQPSAIGIDLQILLALTVLTLAPSLLIMVTSFTRTIIVLSLIRNALGIPQLPPNQVLVGLALFLTFFVMSPTINTIIKDALQPYMQGEIDQGTAADKAIQPLRDFMFRQTNENDLALFVYLAKEPPPATPADVPTYVLIPAFIISELKIAFEMGFLVFIPFLIIDLVVSSTLMSMGMMMLPPVVISLPFKLLLFVLVDGWTLIVRSLVLSFH